MDSLLVSLRGLEKQKLLEPELKLVQIEKFLNCISFISHINTSLNTDIKDFYVKHNRAKKESIDNLKKYLLSSLPLPTLKEGGASQEGFTLEQLESLVLSFGNGEQEDEARAVVKQDIRKYLALFKGNESSVISLDDIEKNFFQKYKAKYNQTVEITTATLYDALRGEVEIGLDKKKAVFPDHNKYQFSSSPTLKDLRVLEKLLEHPITKHLAFGVAKTITDLYVNFMVPLTLKLSDSSHEVMTDGYVEKLQQNKKEASLQLVQFKNGYRLLGYDLQDVWYCSGLLQEIPSVFKEKFKKGDLSVELAISTPGMKFISSLVDQKPYADYYFDDLSPTTVVTVQGKEKAVEDSVAKLEKEKAVKYLQQLKKLINDLIENIKSNRSTRSSRKLSDGEVCQLLQSAIDIRSAIDRQLNCGKFSLEILLDFHSQLLKPAGEAANSPVLRLAREYDDRRLLAFGGRYLKNQEKLLQLEVGPEKQWTQHGFYALWHASVNKFVESGARYKNVSTQDTDKTNAVNGILNKVKDIMTEEQLVWQTTRIYLRQLRNNDQLELGSSRKVKRKVKKKCLEPNKMIKTCEQEKKELLTLQQQVANLLETNFAKILKKRRPPRQVIVRALFYCAKAFWQVINFVTPGFMRGLFKDQLAAKGYSDLAVFKTELTRHIQNASPKSKFSKSSSECYLPPSPLCPF